MAELNDLACEDDAATASVESDAEVEPVATDGCSKRKRSSNEDPERRIKPSLTVVVDPAPPAQLAKALNLPRTAAAAATATALVTVQKCLVDVWGALGTWCVANGSTSQHVMAAAAPVLEHARKGVQQSRSGQHPLAGASLNKLACNFALVLAQRGCLPSFPQRAATPPATTPRPTTIPALACSSTRCSAASTCLTCRSWPATPSPS